MKKKLLIAAIFLIASTQIFAQDYKLRAEYSTNWFNANPAFALDPIGTSCSIGGGTYSTQTIQATSVNDQFVIGADLCNGGFADACNRWTSATPISYNTITTFTQNCCYNAPPSPPGGLSDNTLVTATVNGRYYTTRIEHNAYGNIRGIVSETANAPVEFTNVSAVDNLVYGCLSAAPSSGENVFIRYRIKPAGTWQTIIATMGNGPISSTNNSAASCFNATIPGAVGQDFEFYALTSTATNATIVQADPDLWTLRDYGTDANGQNIANGSGCPKLDNFLTRTTLDSHCVTKGGAVITMNGTVDAAEYQYVTETQHASPLIPETNDANAAANSDFVGESSANIVAYDADAFNYTNFNNIQTAGWGTADIKKFHVSWDATYLYLVVEGPSADKYFGAGALDRMDLFVAIDKDNNTTTNPYQNDIKLTATAAPWNKRVDFNGWTPDYFVAIDRVGPNPSTAGQGKNLTAGFHDSSDHGDYAALFAANNSAPLAEERNMGVLGTCPSFDVSPNLDDLNNGVHEIRIPWTNIGGKPDIYTGQRMNFAVYTTYDEIGFDTYDTGPGLAEGHGKPFEQIGDTPWDGDHWGGYTDPVQGTTDYPAQNSFDEALNADPYDSRVRDNGPGDLTTAGRQPGSDDGNTNGANIGDFDTVEEYYSISNIGQIASKVDCSALPDVAATASAACTTAIPAPRIGTFTETATNANTIINGSSYVTNGGALTVTDAGGCYAETITIAANDVQSSPLNGACVNCPANSYGTTVRTYTITDNSRPTTVPVADCTTPTFGVALTSCTLQTFTRTAVVGINPSLTIQNPTAICAGASVDLNTAITTNTGNTPKFYTTQALADAGAAADVTNPVSPITTTIYYVRVETTTDATCYTTAPITITVTPLPSNLSASADCGATPSNGSATVTVTATGTNLEYAIDNGAYQTSNTFASVINGNHTFTVRVVGTTCTTTTNITVNCANCVANPGVWQN